MTPSPETDALEVPAPTASPVTELRRRIEGRGDELTFELQMAMEGVGLRWHVGSTLTRA